MDKPFYEFQILEAARRFEFESVGSRRIQKCILFQRTTIPDFFTLAMGDLQTDGVLDVDSVSNNGDRDRILATVVQATLVFFREYPAARIGFTGSTPARTRLYQIVIAQERVHLLEHFIIWGLTQNKLELFEPNRAYEALVIYRRNP
jgi:hypothetical protein